MFSKLAFRNLKRSLKDYAIYFFTLALGVAIFYIFNALETQSVMLKISDYMLEIVKLMNSVMSGVSVFVALVLGFLIIYASRFLIKRRSQEFGTYMLLGMSKRKIAMIMLLETLMIGIFSLVAGLLVGVALSQFMSVLVANMFEADMTSFGFVFSGPACVKTLIYFVIIFLVVMLLNTFIIARQRLIKLLQARRTTETVKVRKTWLASIVLMVGVSLLGWAYWMVTLNSRHLDDSNIMFVLAAGAIGTAFFFWSVATIIVKLFQKTKLYNRGLNAFTLRQFSSAINTSAVAMTMICLMLFVTICVSASAISLHESMTANSDKAMPVDIQYPSKLADQSESVEALKDYGIDLNTMMAEQMRYEIAYSDSPTYGDILDKAMPADGAVLFNTDAILPMMHVSDYNALSDFFHNQKVELKDNEYAIVADFATMVELFERALPTQPKIEIAGRNLYPATDEVIDGMYQLSTATSTNTGLVVVPDDIKFREDDATWYTVGNFRENVDAQDLTDKILKIRDQELKNTARYFMIETKQMLLNSNIGINAIVTFVALYLGIIFLIASAALLALKQLSESSDNRAKYAILQKLGVDNKMLNHALGVQIGIFFALPLIVAIIHAICGIIFCDEVLGIFGGIKIDYSMAGIALVFLAIYGGYFLITYFSSKRMIRERRI